MYRSLEENKLCKSALESLSELRMLKKTFENNPILQKEVHRGSRFLAGTFGGSGGLCQRGG